MSKFDELHEAAEQGDPVAQYNLGKMYEEDRGVPKSEEQAFYWYRWAADRGHADAQNNLGKMYEEGRGMPKSHDQTFSYYYDQQAFFWYRDAAKQGHAEAQYNLAKLYCRHRETEQDEMAVYFCADIAVVNANDEELKSKAVKLRDSVGSRLSREDVAKAKRLAQECIDSDYETCPLPYPKIWR